MNKMHPFLRKLLKVLLYSVIIIAFVYITFIIVFGGYGKKEITLDLSETKNGAVFFGHRALSGYYPESSMSAVKGAGEKGLNGVEVDIQRNGEGEFVIFHDEDCERLFGIKGHIDTMSYVEMKKHPLIFHDSIVTNEHVVTLNEMLNVYGHRYFFYFDMKLSDFKTANDIAQVIKKYGIEKNCILANSDIAFVFYVENKYPEINTVLEGFDSGKEWTYYLMPKSLKPDFFSGFSWNMDEGHVNWLKKKELLNYKIVYGVGTDNIRTLLDYGITKLIVDYDTSMAGIGMLK